MNSKIKVLQINKLYYPWIGGVERTVQDIAEGLKDEVHVEVLACQPRGRGVCEAINGVNVTKASSGGIYLGMPLSFTFPWLLARKSRQADILHFHLPFPLGVLSYLMLGSKRKTIVVTYHSDIVRQKSFLTLYSPFLNQFLKKADVILPTSPRLLESSDYLKPHKEKCTVVYSSIDLSKFDQFAQNRFDLGVSPDERIILFVGRLNYYKGLNYLIEAMRDVDAKLLITGNGELRKELENQATSLDVDQRIDFLGEVSDEKLKYLYQICDVFVLPSIEKSEAFGLVQLEAMSCGKPVVNTWLPTGVPFVSMDGETGITVEPRNSEALADAINKLLNNEGLRRKLGAQARRRVEKYFTVEKMNEQILKIYKEIARN